MLALPSCLLWAWLLGWERSGTGKQAVGSLFLFSGAGQKAVSFSVPPGTERLTLGVRPSSGNFELFFPPLKYLRGGEKEGYVPSLCWILMLVWPFAHEMKPIRIQNLILLSQEIGWNKDSRRYHYCWRMVFRLLLKATLKLRHHKHQPAVYPQHPVSFWRQTNHTQKQFLVGGFTKLLSSWRWCDCHCFLLCWVQAEMLRQGHSPSLSCFTCLLLWTRLRDLQVKSWQKRKATGSLELLDITYLPGRRDTIIMKVVFPGWGSSVTFWVWWLFQVAQIWKLHCNS